jgi:alkanesulfonate monooxygenase SsuD/methylene tetrahydromethanopterin reductase-like flavin-dependent oxidoreductase (luciferase family)
VNYGHPLQFGTFITPAATPPEQAVALAKHSEALGYDLVTFQDHPYQPAFLDTWTLLSWVAGQTERVRIVTNVLNLPLRDPAVLARAAASLDLLSDGRFELSIGAGGFWDAIASLGGRRLTPGQSVVALEEAIAVIREIWATDKLGGVRAAGDFYHVVGAKRGPAPAHDIGIWVGAYKPRMLEMIGPTADGWLPSLAYLPGGVADLTETNRRIDEGAAAAGRDASAVRRFLNVGGRFASTGRGFLDGPSPQWAEDLAGVTLTHGITGFILQADDAPSIERFAHEVAPATRDPVAAERGALVGARG